MEERDQKRGGSGAIAFTVAAIVLLLPILYVLSVGPMIWLANRGYVSKDGNEYAPLQWACDRCEPFNQAMDWYIGLFNW